MRCCTGPQWLRNLLCAQVEIVVDPLVFSKGKVFGKYTLQLGGTSPTYIMEAFRITSDKMLVREYFR